AVTEGIQPANEVPEVVNVQATTDQNPSVAGRHKEVPVTDEIEVLNLISQETHAEPVHQLSVENNHNDSRLEIETPGLNIETETQLEDLIHKGTFSMALKDVNDEIVQG
ncbi:hypothetical protein A2U01_0056628, partial [Trifolium medium]|nr:hypothetical protein [Trifolium medium]